MIVRLILSPCYVQYTRPVDPVKIKYCSELESCFQSRDDAEVLIKVNDINQEVKKNLAAKIPENLSDSIKDSTDRISEILKKLADGDCFRLIPLLEEALKDDCGQNEIFQTVSDFFSTINISITDDGLIVEKREHIGKEEYKLDVFTEMLKLLKNECGEGVDFFLGHGFDFIKATDKVGNNLLMAACNKDFRNVAILLLKNDLFDLNHKNKQDETALMMASRNAFHESNELLEMLADQSEIDIHAKNKAEDTALTLACANKNLPGLKILWLRGDYMNIENNDEVCTALSIACMNDFMGGVMFMHTKLKESKGETEKLDKDLLSVAQKVKAKGVVLYFESLKKKYETYLGKPVDNPAEDID